jgi:hypothetical protein
LNRLWIGLAAAAASALALDMPSFSGRPADAASAVRMDVAETTLRASEILEGRVLEVRVARDADGLVRSTVVLDCERDYLTGTGGATRELVFPGGTLEDGSGLLIPGLPTLRAGEQVLLFLTGEGGAGFRLPVGLAQGKWRLVTDRDGIRWALRSDVSAAVVEHDASVQLFGSAARPYADVRAELEAALALRTWGVAK